MRTYDAHIKAKHKDKLKTKRSQLPLIGKTIKSVRETRGDGGMRFLELRFTDDSEATFQLTPVVKTELAFCSDVNSIDGDDKFYKIPRS